MLTCWSHAQRSGHGSGIVPCTAAPGSALAVRRVDALVRLRSLPRASATRRQGGQAQRKRHHEDVRPACAEQLCRLLPAVLPQLCSVSTGEQECALQSLLLLLSSVRAAASLCLMPDCALASSCRGRPCQHPAREPHTMSIAAGNPERLSGHAATAGTSAAIRQQRACAGRGSPCLWPDDHVGLSSDQRSPILDAVARVRARVLTAVPLLILTELVGMLVSGVDVRSPPRPVLLCSTCQDCSSVVVGILCFCPSNTRLTDMGTSPL